MQYRLKLPKLITILAGANRYHLTKKIVIIRTRISKLKPKDFDPNRVKGGWRSPETGSATMFKKPFYH
jgi:hypothetical protein